ncbi:MAG: DUF1697 domain-containing protein [Acidobacteria bacterium]|nr:MAG: DUF1697 domain-containing protein [Acidobacteriota bacterium]
MNSVLSSRRIIAITKRAKYIAFLRGINVGGHKLIKMEALAAAFTAAGFRNVKTYIASGNVIFESRATKVDGLEKKAERKLLETFGHEIAVVIFSIAELQALIESDPLKAFDSHSDVMLVVTFLKQRVLRVKLPLESKTENLEVFAIQDRAAFTVARRKKTGWFGFPNNFIEKKLGCAATTRQWRTVEKVVAVAERL